MRRSLYLFVWLCICLDAASAQAQSLGEQLDSLLQWSLKHQPKPTCTESCYALSTLTLSGSLEKNQIDFTLTGELWTEGPFAIPLFGPAKSLRLEQVTLNGRPASITFSGSTYYALTNEKSFTIQGRFSFSGSSLLEIPGPLNRLVSSIEGASLDGGNDQAGLLNASLSLYAQSGSTPEAPPEVSHEPPVYQISRDFKIEEDISFEYRVSVQSAQEITEVTLPLLMNEKVVSVTGAKIRENKDGLLSLTTSGNTANILISGKLPSLTSLSVDPRVSYEWWTIERDARHRVITSGSAQQIEASESPMRAQQTLPIARFFLAKPGESLEIKIQALESLEALAAIISTHNRHLIWTREGDLVIEDRFFYENGGLENLPYGIGGTPIYAESDGAARLLLKDTQDPTRLLLPLSTGAHQMRVQALDQAAPATFFGSLSLPAPSHPFEVSKGSVTLGLPEEIYPLYLTETGWVGPGSGKDLAALLASVLLGALLFRRRPQRLMASVSLLGLWFVLRPFFVPLVSLLVVGGLLRWCWRTFSGRRLFVSLLVLLLGVGLSFSSVLSLQSELEAKEVVVEQENNQPFYNYLVTNNISSNYINPEDQRATDNNELRQSSVGSVLETTRKGIRPVALPLPGFAKEVSASRELVTRERPLSPVLYYTTQAALWPLLILWALAVVATLFFAYPRLKAGLLALKEELERAGTPREAPALQENRPNI